MMVSPGPRPPPAQGALAGEPTSAARRRHNSSHGRDVSVRRTCFVAASVTGVLTGPGESFTLLLRLRSEVPYNVHEMAPLGRTEFIRGSSGRRSPTRGRGASWTDGATCYLRTP